MKLYSDDRGLGRMLGFSDGVFAIALTLLILDIRFPDVHITTNQEFYKQLSLLAPKFYGFALSFWIVSIYWTTHHRMFRYINKYNDTLLQLNLIFLFFVSFLPFPTAILSRFGDTSGGTAFYAAWLTFTGLSSGAIWYYSSHAGLIDKHVQKEEIQYGQLRSVISTVIFLISMGLAYINPYLAEASWIALFFIRPVLKRRFADI